MIAKHKQHILKTGYYKDMTGGSSLAMEKEGKSQIEMTLCILITLNRITNTKRYPDNAFKFQVYFL